MLHQFRGWSVRRRKEGRKESSAFVGLRQLEKEKEMGRRLFSSSSSSSTTSKKKKNLLFLLGFHGFNEEEVDSLTHSVAKKKQAAFPPPPYSPTVRVKKRWISIF